MLNRLLNRFKYLTTTFFLESDMTDKEAAGHPRYHLKFDEYVPLESESAMRAHSNAMLGSKPSSNSASSSKTQEENVSRQPTRPRKESSARSRAPPTPASPTRGRFVQLNVSTETAASADFAYGIVHLYRDVIDTHDAKIASVGRAASDEENILAILAVPSYMTANDFMGFVGERERNQVSHFRMIRTEAANRYMVLLKFRTNDSAKEFHTLFNGKYFNSMEVRRQECTSNNSPRHVMLSSLEA